jgi:hypothetical protein
LIVVQSYNSYFIDRASIKKTPVETGVRLPKLTAYEKSLKFGYLYSTTIYAKPVPKIIF